MPAFSGFDFQDELFRRILSFIQPNVASATTQVRNHLRRWLSTEQDSPASFETGNVKELKEFEGKLNEVMKNLQPLDGLICNGNYIGTRSLGEARPPRGFRACGSGRGQAFAAFTPGALSFCVWTRIYVVMPMRSCAACSMFVN